MAEYKQDGIVKARFASIIADWVVEGEYHSLQRVHHSLTHSLNHSPQIRRQQRKFDLLLVTQSIKLPTGIEPNLRLFQDRFPLGTPSQIEQKEPETGAGFEQSLGFAFVPGEQLAERQPWELDCGDVVGERWDFGKA